MRRRSAPEAAARRGGPPCAGEAGEAGFTLLETLVALVVAAILSIGLVRFMASTHVASAHADRTLAVAALETAVMAALPLASDGAPFHLSGSRGAMDWDMTGTPILEKSAPAEEAADTGAAPPAPGGALAAPAPPARPLAWQRYAVSVTIRSGGAVLDRFETIRIGTSGRAGGAAAP